MTTKETFWQLLGGHKIVIPIIQRDYAQGRDDPKTKQVREGIVAAIKKALDGTPLDFGLVYGAISKDGNLTILDGQQRITTLFLVHWYLAARAGGKLDDRFGCFTYETRTTARDFSAALAKGRIDIAEKPEISEQIQDANWFFHSWKEDPTIKGMLVMLDAIHMVFKEADAAAAWECLISTSNPCPITFQFLSMGDFGLTDDLYIKMNARGKPLTEFENFKAWLEGRHSKNTGILPADWEMKLDKEWADLFWKNRGNAVDIGPACMRFFKGVALANFIFQNGKNKDEARLIDEVTRESFMTKESLEALLGDEKSLNFIFQVLEKLSGEGLAKIEEALKVADFFLPPSEEKPLEESLFRHFVSSAPTLPSRVMFHAICCFLVKYPEVPLENCQELVRWMRVVRNLTVNTVITNENFARAIGTISSMSKESNGNILEWLAAGSGKELPSFLRDQVAEEVRKAKLILKDGAWESVLMDAENHPYFEGQINFLLEMAAGERGKFEQYRDLAKTIFVSGGLIENRTEFPVQRALLATQGNLKDSYLFNGSNIGSHSEPARNKAIWRSIFRTKQAHLAQLFDRLKIDAVESGLTSIISESKIEDWRSLFINSPTVFNQCGMGNIHFSVDDRILLLSKQRTSSAYSELHSFCFYVKHAKVENADFLPFEFGSYSRSGRDIDAHAFLESKEYRVEIRYSSKAYEIRLKKNNGESIAPELKTKNSEKYTEAGSAAGDKKGADFSYSTRCETDEIALAEIMHLARALYPVAA